jgi:hypothetical protein
LAELRRIRKENPAKAPSRASKAPSRASKAPTRAAKAPTRAAKAPTRAAKAPSRSATVPSAPTMSSPHSPELAVGMAVLAPFQGSDDLFPGTIMTMGRKVCFVEFKDGDKDPHVRTSAIKPSTPKEVKRKRKARDKRAQQRAKKKK